MKQQNISWKEDSVTQSQLRLIRRIVDESNFPLPQFDGKTKGQAAQWIEKYKDVARRSIE